MLEAINLSKSLFHQKLYGLKDSLWYGQQVNKIVEHYISSRPFRLNVIEAACHGRFKETGHSMVLAEMLRHPIIQASFLETFLGLKYDHLEVAAETDRVDVSLKGDGIFIIVENKINGAVEQDSQVYRYVHEIGMEKYGYALSQIYVIYLNPTNRTSPTDFSLCDKNGKHNAFKELGCEHYIVLSYKDDITNWLGNLTIDNEPLIQSALEQYIDFLESKFNTSLLDKAMNNEIKELILKELQIADKSRGEQIAVLENQRDKTEDLLNHLNSLVVELKKAASLKMIREWQKQIEQQLKIKLAQDDHSFGIQLNNKVWLRICDGVEDGDETPYWGFYFNSFRKDSNPRLYNKIERIIDSAGLWEFDNTFDDWIAWHATENGIETFIALYHAAEEKGLI